ncbi:MAG: ion transporter [Sulfuricurvum sp.]|uniref:ion transporter n=1 Tax=Sulfuricurvum sp. TaxID=2025608 RepID=UPI002608188B|nr:ion transporter [Sulfuricurvum sp.]MDD2829658.1 ion transporter [Sulfuricurvum sp.]MDD4948674.1 ion transporter [Sulfuricurvum sp.]
MISKYVVNIAYFLHTCHPYQHSKIFFYNLLENQNYRYKKYFDYFMIGLIFLSVYILIRSVKHEISHDWLIFNNYIISLIFLTEYLIRFWIYSNNSKIIIDQYEHDLFLHREFSFTTALKKMGKEKFKYISSPMAVIDILAIMPFFHELRIFRIFVLFRVLKFFRYAKSLRRLISILASKKFEIMTLVIFALIMIMVSSVLIYVMEANHPDSKIMTLADALYWSVVTIFTVGYGDIVPVTSEGRSVAMLIIVAGIAVISVATSIVVSAFSEKIDEIKEEKLLEEVSRLERFYLICGYSPLTHEVIRKLHKRHLPMVVLEKDSHKVAQARTQGLLAIGHDSASLHTYHLLKVNFEKQVEAVILLHESDVTNIYAALTIRELTKHTSLFSILHHPENRRKLSLAGIESIINPHELIGMMSKIVSTQPIAFEVIHALRSEETSTVVEEIWLDSGMGERFFKLLHDPLFYQRFSVLGIYKYETEKFLFNPSPDIEIQMGDVAIVIANRSLVDEFRTKLHRKQKR